MTDISLARRDVINGNWTVINDRTYTLTGLGLRHNGSGLVWAKSGESVRKVDHDTGFSGAYAISDDYHAKLDGKRPLETYVLTRGVHAHKVDDLCFGVLHRSGAMIEYTHRSNGARLATHAVRIPNHDKQHAFKGFYIFRSPSDEHYYMLLHEELDRTIIEACLSQGYSCESTYELSLVVATAHEFSLFMERCGYIPIQTRQITGKQERFWVYRGNRKSKGHDEILAPAPQEVAPRKVCSRVVQLSHKPRKAFKPVALDGQNVYIYDDHERFLTKKRHRVNGIRVQGYTAKGLTVEVIA